MDPLEEGAVHQAIPQGTIDPEAQITEEVQLATNRPLTKDQSQDTHATGRCDSRNRSHASQGINNPCESDRRENLEPLSGGEATQAGHSRDAASMATAFEPLNRSLETFLTRLSRTKEPMNVVKSPEEFLRNQDAIKTNLMAVLIPG